MQWDCIDHRWVSWSKPKAMPVHNSLWARLVFKKRRWGEVWMIRCGIAYRRRYDNPWARKPD